MDNHEDILFIQLKKAANAIHPEPASDVWDKIQRKKQPSKLSRIVLLTISIAACLTVVVISVRHLQNPLSESAMGEASYQLTPLQEANGGSDYFSKSKVDQLFVSYQKANLIQKK